MLLGIYPRGPYHENSVPNENHRQIDVLISALIGKDQFTALNELLQECDPLDRLTFLPNRSSPLLLSEFFATVLERHASLSCLKFSIPFVPTVRSEFTEKVRLIADFITRSPRLEKFCMLGVDNNFSPSILDAISSVGNAKSFIFYFHGQLSDEACQKLEQMIRRCRSLNSVVFHCLDTSEKKSADIFRALSSCPQLTELSFTSWQFGETASFQALQSLLENTKTLETFKCADWFSNRGDLSQAKYRERLHAFNLGIAANTSLRSLSLGAIAACKEADCFEQLIQVLKQHRTIESLEFDGEDFGLVGTEHKLELLADLVEHNQRIVEIKGLVLKQSPYPNTPCAGAAMEATPKDYATLLTDRLTRNKAIASSEIARVFSQVFFPSPGAPAGPKHIGDPGLHLTEHMLRLSPNLSNFEKTMVEVALSLDEPT